MIQATTLLLFSGAVCFAVAANPKRAFDAVDAGADTGSGGSVRLV